MKILLVEDDPAVAANVAEGLEAAGHEVDVAGDGVTGLRLASAGAYAVVVLDRMLPRMDGLAVCRELRAQAGPAAPVLFLTARDDLEDKLAGFEAGADDYLSKPFEFAELRARVEALGRRGGAAAAPQPELLAFGPLRYHLGTREARRGDRRLCIGRVGHSILRELLLHAPDVVTKERLEELLWDGFSPGGSVLRTHIYALRKAIDAPGEAPLLETLHGVGYRLALDGKDPDDATD